MTTTTSFERILETSSSTFWFTANFDWSFFHDHYLLQWVLRTSERQDRQIVRTSERQNVRTSERQVRQNVKYVRTSERQVRQNVKYVRTSECQQATHELTAQQYWKCRPTYLVAPSGHLHFAELCLRSSVLAGGSEMSCLRGKTPTFYFYI
jgi:hypothetical protein